MLEDFKLKFSPNGERVILLVGRLDTTRRTNDLIQAYHSIRQEFSNVSLVIVGDGSEKANNGKEVQRLGLKNVYFEGAIYDDELLAKYFMISDFFVTPGVASMAIKIAMLFGVPVITADYGLEVHAVKNGVNGYIYTLGDYKQISNHIKSLINDPSSYLKYLIMQLKLLKKKLI